MPDISHIWGSDIALSPTGDLKIVDGTDRGTQRVIRRLMTAATRIDAYGKTQTGEYVFHTGYGGSVPQRIGDTLDANLVMAVVAQQISFEAAVATVPPPKITVTPFLTGVTVGIVYADAATGAQTALTFNVNA
jgi:hypothetical protein